MKRVSRVAASQPANNPTKQQWCNELNMHKHISGSLSYAAEVEVHKVKINYEKYGMRMLYSHFGGLEGG